MHLQGHGDHDPYARDLHCSECRKRMATGPCAACESMICTECGVFSKDPSGQRVICLSCARLIADVKGHPLRAGATKNALQNQVVVYLLVIAVLTSLAAMIISSL